MNRLKLARGAFADLLNALDDARIDISDDGEKVVNGLVADIERIVRRFDAAFGNEPQSPAERQAAHLAEFGK